MAETVNSVTETVNSVTKTDNSITEPDNLCDFINETTNSHTEKQISSAEIEECNNIKIRIKRDLQRYQQITGEDLFPDLRASLQELLTLEVEEESINSSVQACSENRDAEERRNARQ